MNQKKIGLLLKELRKEKNLTQEQLAEQFNISSRSVSRWETGTNLPDLSILVELADFYDIDIREIIDGERKNEMNNETKETLNKVAEYAEQNTINLKRRMAGNCAGALLLLLFCVVLDVTNGFNGFIADRPFNHLMDFSLGLTIAILFMNILFLTGKLEAIQNWKNQFFHKN